MGETRRRPSEGGPAPHGGRDARGELRGRALHLGEDALRFTRWYVKGKYALMEGFLGDLDDAPEERDVARLRERYCRALSHGRRVVVARTVVTVLLALGAITTAVAAVAGATSVRAGLDGNLAFLQTALGRLAAWSAAFAVVLVMLRLAFDRYLALVDTSATFLAMQIATAPRDDRRGPS